MKRISKIDPDKLTGEPRKIFERWQPGGKILNIVLIYFRNIELNRTWSYMATHLFLKNSLSDRQREIVVLRTSWQCASDYEFIQHVRIAREGRLLSEEEMRDLTREKLSLNWPEDEQALSDACDELLATHGLGDNMWERLAKHFNEHQLMDIVATAGGYTLNSMATNSFGVDIESHMDREDGLTPSVNERGFCFGSVGRPAQGAPGARITPLPLDDIDEATRQTIAPYLERDRSQNFFQTIARYPKIVRNWMPVIKYVDSENTLDPVDRTIVALRTAARCYSQYELAHRSREALQHGMSRDEIEDIIETTTGETGDVRRTLLIRAVDELVDDKLVGDVLWGQLGEHYGEEEMMDIVFGCAIGLMVCWMQNVLRVQCE